MSRRSNIVHFLVILVLFVIITEKRASASPCGICGVDVICSDKFPICSKRQVIMLDYCGCCLVCKKILDKGEGCSTHIANDEFCKADLECVNNKCTSTKTTDG